MLGRALQFSRWLVSPPPVVRTPRASTPVPTTTDRPAPPQNVASCDADALRRPAASRRNRCRHRASLRPSHRRLRRRKHRRHTIARAPAIITRMSLDSRCAPASASGHWTWNGGSPVTVGYGETVESIARKHGVPVSALMQTNGIRDAGSDQTGPAPRYPALCVERAAKRADIRRAAARPAATFTS